MRYSKVNFLNYIIDFLKRITIFGQISKLFANGDRTPISLKIAFAEVKKTTKNVSKILPIYCNLKRKFCVIIYVGIREVIFGNEKIEL